MMTINRYRLKHLARGKHKAALRVNRLLERVDRLLGEGKGVSKRRSQRYSS